MTTGINIVIENKLIMEKRDVNLYHQSMRRAYMIGSNSTIDVSLRSVLEEDYLHISVVSGPGPLAQKCVINIPSWADFEFSSEGNLTATHSGDRTLLKIPPGPATWQLKITLPVTSLVNRQSDRVIIADNPTGYP